MALPQERYQPRWAAWSRETPCTSLARVPFSNSRLRFRRSPSPRPDGARGSWARATRSETRPFLAL